MQIFWAKKSCWPAFLSHYVLYPAFFWFFYIQKNATLSDDVFALFSLHYLFHLLAGDGIYLIPAEDEELIIYDNLIGDWWLVIGNFK